MEKRNEVTEASYMHQVAGPLWHRITRKVCQTRLPYSQVALQSFSACLNSPSWYFRY